MMYGGATPHMIPPCTTRSGILSCPRPTSLFSANITSSFCVLPLTTNTKGFRLFYGLRLALLVMPTGLWYAFVKRFLISMFWFTVSVKHFTSLPIKFCLQQWRWSRAAKYAWACGAWWYQCGVVHPYIIIAWCKMVFWGVGLYLVLIFGISFTKACF